MPFKTDKQRKAFFAMKGANSKSAISPQIMRNNKQDSFNELKKKGIFLKFQGDADKDGVVNIKDCRPFDPEKQGRLHDLALRALKKKEEFVERRREKQMKKLEDLKDSLRARKELLAGRNAVLAEKQAIITEFKREKDNLRMLKKANIDAKRELFKTGKIAGIVRATGRGAKAFGRGVVAAEKGRRKGVKVGIKAGRTTAKRINNALDISASALKATNKILGRIVGQI